ncbi:MAG: isopeptide-forming domain-containing fimbrial protein, partial [Gammaproteobacteria bacterium]|nr:isopeptide-forming domain-containing fimbrial protein [Gammaproteobacteria bacterium]
MKVDVIKIVRYSLSTCFIALGSLLFAANAVANVVNCSTDPNTISGIISYDLSANNSYCELCGTGQIRLLVTNPSHVDMANFEVTHDFLSSGLEYVPGSTIGGSDPVINGTQLTWTSAQLPALAQIDGINQHSNYNSVEIIFQQRSIAGTEENLISANRTISASATYDYCPVNTNVPSTASSGPVLLPLLEPQPNVVKLGRNTDAAQAAGSYANIVYGNINDDVIWRIQINNTGSADLQDLKFDELMQNGNFQTNFACSTEAEASSIAAADGAGPVGNCVAAGNSITDFFVDDPFGTPANDEPSSFVDVPQGGSTFIYLVGKITNSCNSNTTNTVSNVQWGCEVNPADGGISQTSSGQAVASSSTTLSTLVQNNGLVIQRALTGLNTAQPVGTRGLMTITLSNSSGGSIKNIKLRDVLPAEYVVDSTFTPTITVTPQFAAYNGMIDTINWTNPVAGTFPLVSSDPADPLANTAPEFDLVSSTVHPDHADQINMLRQGDVAVVTFRVVMIPPAYFDNNANIDVRVENTADSTDPANSSTLANQLFVTFENFCSPGVLQNPSSYPYADNFLSDPEDLDIDITGTELIFILTNDVTQPLPLQISLSNNGGHYADDYSAYITFGATMEVITWPAGCAATTNPPALEVWDDPADLPASATVYQCTSAGIGTIAPGQTRNLNFEVVKTTDPARLNADDLSLRADVVGEVTLSDGSLLWFPTPDTATISNRANNYSLDSVRARVIGFNLSKNIIGNCSENIPAALNPDSQVQIGEECSVKIDTGGWFGFQTPGFTYIAVQRIQVVDQLPDGQAYISSTDPSLTSSANIRGISLNPAALSALDEGWFDWTFNQLVPTERITVKDQWFVVNATSRILNKPIDSVALPNRHAAVSRNVLNSTFEAVFNNASSGQDEIFTLGPGTIGYPTEAVRRVDLTVTEPNILLSKQACNESLYGVGVACGNFTTLVDDGDTQDAYIYRITLTNQASSSGVARAPAYNIIASDILDNSDLMLIEAFATDGLDNDADGLIDAADLDGEGSISDNIIANAAPATITFSHTHSTGLLQLNAGASLSFYYRVNPDDAIAPLQQLTNSVTLSYDSLEGTSGNQTVLPSANSELAGARVYNSGPATATVQILPLQAQPKEIIALSNTALSGSQPQPVSVGEEVEYRLRTLIPVAHLKDFFIRDELPAGISCVEAPVIDLSAAPYSDAGFFPAGIITPTCNDNLVYWYFGDQELTSASSNNLFDFPVTFIARLNNSAAVNNADIISNGPPSTNTFVSYLNEADVQVINNFARFDLIVREPVISLSKSYESAINDAGDIITVTVTASNTGTATAYNLRVLDDLATVSNLTFLNNVAGSDPPDITDTTTLGANRPIFSWLAGNPNFTIAAGDSVSFSFDIQVNDSAKPHEILDNTIQASWTSLPGQSTALNQSGSIGTNGSGTGMRTGSLPNASDAVNDYESSASTFSTVPGLSISKNDLSPALATEIGTHKNFEIVINLPEGITNNLIVNDQLDSSGLSYVLSNNASFDITYSFSGIATINGSTPSEAAFTAFPADATSATASWNIGTVVTMTEDDTAGAPAINPSIRINYFAHINNDLSTDAGSGLQNNASISYSNGEDGSIESLNDDTPLITVTEPVLLVAKTASPISAAPITAGDIIEYVISVSNSGNATAYDVNIVDSLPSDSLLYSAFKPTAVIDTVLVGSFISTPANNPDGPLVWGRNNGDDSLDIAAGSTLVLSYQIQIQATAEASDSLTNSVQVDWTSLNGSSIYERDGSACPATVAPDDYCAAPATAVFSIDDSSTLNKSVSSDSFAPTNDATLRVGDFVTYQLDLNLQEGTSRAVSVLDVLPAGLAFVDIVSINGDNSDNYTAPATGAGSNFSYAAVSATALPVAGQTGNLSFTIGDVVNDPFADPTTDNLSIIYRARVLQDTLDHSASSSLSNTATLAYIDGAGSPVVAPARLESNATITVLQPIMTVPTKTDRSGRPNNSNVSITTDLMNYRLSSCNTSGLAPAYSLHITDLLASQYDEASISGPVNGATQPDVYINGVLTTAGGDYLYTPPTARGGSLLFELITPVNPGQCVEIDYDIGFYNDFGANQNWENTVTVDEYWSLASQSGQLYPALSPASFTVMNNNPYVPPVKAMLSPANGEATIGEEVVYSITLPASNAARFDVVITDTLDPALEYISFTEVSGNGFVLTDNTVAPGDVNLSIAFIPAGQELVVELLTRVANNASANAGSSFNNTVTYTHADSAGGTTILAGSDSTTSPLLVTEPFLIINKTVSNNSNPGNLPVAGDILRYSLNITASGTGAGDNYAPAFDIELLDQLSSGLLYQPGTSTVSGGSNSIAEPVQVGDGITIAQQLNWSLAAGNADIDIAEGVSITVTYNVLVLDTVLANQVLSNSVVAKWSGIDGANINERTGSASPAVNDYFSTPASTSINSADNNSITKTRLSDTFTAADNTVRIGDLVQYELRVALQQGLSNALLVTDSLPQGLVFESVSRINADSSAPFSSSTPLIHNDVSISAAGDPALGSSTLTFDFGNVTNVADANNSNDEIVIIYTARVLDNVHAQINNTTLNNTVQLGYLSASGTVINVSSADISLLQPVLNVTKSAVAAAGDTVLVANELVTYTVDISNTGSAPAYDLLLEDIIPAGMRNGSITTLSTTLVNSATSLTNITPVYNAVTGLASWDFDSGVANSHTIPPNETLRLVYQLQADANIGASLTLNNQVSASHYYSFDNNAVPQLASTSGVREVYGPSSTASASLTTAAPGALFKENPATSTVAVGEVFSYQITIPATPITTMLHDVRILDDLTASAADLIFVNATKVSGSLDWTPVNSGSSSSLIIEDTSSGIDIPAGEQVVLNISVQVMNTATNISGLLFNNTATYTYNQLANDNSTQQAGTGSTTADMTIVGPDSLTLVKSGPAEMRIGIPAIFTLDVQNTGTATAWDLTITDLLPNFEPLAGGMCNVAPANITAQTFLADGITAVSGLLLQGSDYMVNFEPAPACRFNITLQSAAAALAANHRLIVTYEASLDIDTPPASTLVNVAGVTQWFSQNTAGSGATGETKTFTRVLTDGSTTLLDHQDAHSVAVETPVILVQKRVQNISSGQNPGANAQPGDTLRYSIFIQNLSDLE